MSIFAKPTLRVMERRTHGWTLIIRTGKKLLPAASCLPVRKLLTRTSASDAALSYRLGLHGRKRTNRLRACVSATKKDIVSLTYCIRFIVLAQFEKQLVEAMSDRKDFFCQCVARGHKQINFGKAMQYVRAYVRTTANQ